MFDDGFLVHSPGVAKRKGYIAESRHEAIREQTNLIIDVIKPQLRDVYGENPQCDVKTYVKENHQQTDIQFLFI